MSVTIYLTLSLCVTNCHYSELRLAEAKLSSTEKELESLSVERLKHGANVYR